MNENSESAISREDYEVSIVEPLSYFIGAWLGDGWVTYNPFTRNYSVCVKCMDREIITKCYIDVSNHFSDLREGRIYTELTKNETKLYKVVWWSKKFVELMHYTMPGKVSFPEYIWRASKDARLNMLSGLMDTDGTIVQHADGRNWHCTFTGTKGFVRQFPDLCRMLGIRINSRNIEKHQNPNHIDRLQFNLSIPTMIDAGFKFHCDRKQDRLNKFIEQHSTLRDYTPSPTK
uniref:Putative terminase n=1 Tax=viral metagenome TaxID=1070528 RepID=A0A6M3KRE9_9ZZZZ